MDARMASEVYDPGREGSDEETAMEMFAALFAAWIIALLVATRTPGTPKPPRPRRSARRRPSRPPALASQTAESAEQPAPIGALAPR
jgi:hypothetical protein